MNLKESYWYFESVIDKKTCEELIKIGLKKTKEIATTGSFSGKDLKNKNKIKLLKQKRNSNVVWFEEKWLFDLLQPYIISANQNSKWNFQWDFSENIQFTIYKKGQFYHWHKDSWEEPYSDINNKFTFGKIRKLSLVLSLNDASEYEGGELMLDFNNIEPDKKRIFHTCDAMKKAGSIIVFPSFLWHKVSPVTKGTRYSMVMWNLGQQYK